MPNTQTAPFPTDLEELVHDIDYKGWDFYLDNFDRGQDSTGLTLTITARVTDTYHPEKTIRINHLFIVPAASYDYMSWRRWLLDQVLLVEQHEACEFFVLDGDRPFAPHHGPGENPYTIYEHGSAQQVRTLSSGRVKE